MSKFKIGDKVLLKNRNKSHSELVLWLSSMNRFNNTVQTISYVDDYLGLWVKFEEADYCFDSSWLVPIGELGEAIYV